ncbi:uncharacterized protein LOC144628816 [Oculina patagonica]
MWKVKVLAVTLLLLVFVSGVESWRRRRRRRSPPPCTPRTCQVSSWSTWSPCSHQCGTSGTYTRKRTITVAASCGGPCPFPLSQTRPCNRGKCQNAGTPTSKGCSCRPGYQGTCCEIAITTPRPTVFSSVVTATPPSSPPSTQPPFNATTRPPTNAPPVHFANFLSFNNGNYNVSWMYDNNTDRLHFVTEVMTTGWVGFGVATRAPNAMIGYDVAVGGVLSDGTGYLRDYLTIGRQQPQLDAQQDWVLTYSREENGVTTLQFYRQRDTNDFLNDIVIQQGEPIFLIWAYHLTSDVQSGQLFQQHTFRGLFQTILIPGIPTSSTPACLRQIRLVLL